MADRRERIYYPVGSISSGLYTNGGELMEKDGTPYVGQYHTYKNTKEIFNVMGQLQSLQRIKKSGELENSYKEKEKIEQHGKPKS